MKTSIKIPQVAVAIRVPVVLVELRFATVLLKISNSGSVAIRDLRVTLSSSGFAKGRIIWNCPKPVDPGSTLESGSISLQASRRTGRFPVHCEIEYTGAGGEPVKASNEFEAGDEVQIQLVRGPGAERSEEVVSQQVASAVRLPAPARSTTLDELLERAGHSPYVAYEFNVTKHAVDQTHVAAPRLKENRTARDIQARGADLAANSGFAPEDEEPDETDELGTSESLSLGTLGHRPMLSGFDPEPNGTPVRTSRPDPARAEPATPAMVEPTARSRGIFGVLAGALVFVVLGGAAYYWYRIRPANLETRQDVSRVSTSVSPSPAAEKANSSTPSAEPARAPASANSAAPAREIHALGLEFRPVLIGVPPTVRTVQFSRFEITVGQFQKYAQANGLTWLPPTDSVPDHPVTGITVADATEFCRWLTRSDGGRHIYRLPTDEEWSWAVGIGPVESALAYGKANPEPFAKDGRILGFPWGSQPKVPETIQSLPGLTGQRRAVRKVTETWENPLGLWGLEGNVREWVSDLYDAGSGLNVARGGAWGDTDYAKAASSARATSDGKHVTIGFRVCFDAGAN